jgi:hypothetical protein
VVAARPSRTRCDGQVPPRPAGALRPAGRHPTRPDPDVPWLFELPWFRRFVGYALPGTIVLRRPLEQVSDDLICHELCHVWQLQRRPVAVPVAFLRHGYRRNPFELEARHAAAVTRERIEGSGGRAVGSGAQGP